MKINLNKLFPFLSIRIKLIVAFSLLSIVPLSIIGIVGFYNNMSTMREAVLGNLKHEVDLVNEKTSNFLSNIEVDIKLISQFFALRKYVDLISGDKVTNSETVYNQTIDDFFSFVNTKQGFYLIRFIDSEGEEKIRIQFNNEKYEIIPEERLSESSFRFYFVLTDSLQTGQIAFVPAELRGLNQVTIPTFSFALRIYNSQNKFSGILIGDIFAKNLFQILEEKNIMISKEKLYWLMMRATIFTILKKRRIGIVYWLRGKPRIYLENIRKNFPRKYYRGKTESLRNIQTKSPLLRLFSNLTCR